MPQVSAGAFLVTLDAATGNDQWTTFLGRPNNATDQRSTAQHLITDTNGNSYVHIGETGLDQPKEIIKLDSQDPSNGEQFHPLEAMSHMSH